MELEVCVGGLDDALICAKLGVKRIEMNSALYLGGLTPQPDIVRYLKENTQLEISSMVRCRGGGFIYNENEYKQMFIEAVSLLEAGSDGIVFGFLNDDLEIDIEKCKEMITLIHSYHKKAIFHRAIDVSKDPIKNIKLLKELGIDRVLSSGTKNKAVEGLSLLKEMNKFIEVLPGSGINKDNAYLFKSFPYIHASCRSEREDISTSHKHVSFFYGCHDFEYVDPIKVKEILEVIKDAEVL